MQTGELLSDGPALAEGNVLVAEEAEDDGDARNDGSCDVGSQLTTRKQMLKQAHEKRHGSEAQQGAGSIHANAACPLRQVVPVGAEDEPFISQKCGRDGDDAGEEAGVHVAICAEAAGEEPVEESEKAVAEDGVESTDKEVAQNFRC